MNRFCLLLLPAAVFVFFSCDPDPVPDVSGKQLLDPLFESAYMTMPPSSAGDFASPVRCFYTGRMLPPGRNVRFSETAETVLIPGTDAAVPSVSDSRWQTAESFSADKPGLYSLFLRRPGETAVSRYRFIVTESFGSVLQLTVKAGTFTAKGWATSVVEYRKGSDLTSFTDANRVLGGWFAHRSEAVTDPVYDVVSLGNGGSLTIEWEIPAANGPGPDFAVFENGMSANENSVFAELAFVEVSSNGIDFERFDSVSKGTVPIPDGGQIAADSVYGLAGVKPLGYGTLFDLDELAGRESVADGRLDLNRVRYLRLVDIPGCGGNTDGYEAMYDSFGHIIYDAFKTYGSAGFDAACTAVLNSHE